MYTYLVALLVIAIESITLAFFLIYLILVKQKTIFYYFCIFYIAVCLSLLIGNGIFYDLLISSKEMLHFNAAIWIFLDNFVLSILILFILDPKSIKKIFFWLIFLFIPIIFFIKVLTVDFVPKIIVSYFGFINLLPVSSWTDTFLIFRIIYLLVGLLILGKFYKTTQKKYKKRKSKIFLIAICSLLFFSLVNFLFYYLSPAKNTFWISCEVMISPVIWSIVWSYAIIKYKFLIATLSEAAENIVSVMPDGLFFLDANRNIVRVNQSIFNSLGYSEKELIGEPIEKFFNPSEINLIQELVSTSIVKDKQVKLKNKDGKEIPFIISGVAINNQEGDLYYIVLITKDTKEIKKYAALRLSQLTPILQKVSQGDFSKTIEIPAEKDEFTQHLLTLNIMIDNFKKLVKEINDKSIQLEYQNQELEKVSSQLQQKMIELERFNKVAVEKEIKMIELKKEIKKLKAKDNF